jgi:fluoroacetyl-CoA thioesterase
MKPSLKPGLTHRFSYTVPITKTVPHLYEEAPELAVMPEVFASGFMVWLMEWTCVQLLAPHLDPGEGSLGVYIDVAHDGIDEIGSGIHERFIVNWNRFNKSVAAKAATVNAEVDS